MSPPQRLTPLFLFTLELVDIWSGPTRLFLSVSPSERLYRTGFQILSQCYLSPASYPQNPTKYSSRLKKPIFEQFSYWYLLIFVDKHVHTVGIGFYGTVLINRLKVSSSTWVDRLHHFKLPSPSFFLSHLFCFVYSIHIFQCCGSGKIYLMLFKHICTKKHLIINQKRIYQLSAIFYFTLSSPTVL